MERIARHMMTLDVGTRKDALARLDGPARLTARRVLALESLRIQREGRYLDGRRLSVPTPPGSQSLSESWLHLAWAKSETEPLRAPTPEEADYCATALGIRGGR